MFGIQSLSFDPLEHLETFSGCMSITRAEWEARRAAVPMDVVLSSDHDILSDVGYANMLHQAHHCYVLVRWQNQETDVGVQQFQGHPEVSEINNYADHSLIPENTAEMVVHYVDSSGKQRIKGGGDLKASQAYPRRFGKAVSKVRSKHAAKHRAQAAKFLRLAKKTPNVANCAPAMNAKWMKMANLEPIFNFLAK
ncbi:unnamed protein product [Durusdinium trenchii]|uniref:Uncharacterized protein n=1 Tax=Durusdinium trenchii TaxID=1381693 RepID=A0ABP0RTU9_9DINO